MVNRLVRSFTRRPMSFGTKKNNKIQSNRYIGKQGHCHMYRRKKISNLVIKAAGKSSLNAFSKKTATTGDNRRAKRVF